VVSEGGTLVGIARARGGATPATTGGPARAERVDEATIRAALGQVMDPEIPVLSVVDLGIVEEVSVSPSAVRVTILPTFVGCPALELIRSAIADRLAVFGRAVHVEVSFAVPWTSDRITEAGRRALHDSGFAPPSPAGAAPIVLGRPVECPHCGSRRTVLENVFGPTQCRSIHHCTACRQPFEQFKAI
jgi:ring-1,2-phenylacetyl-CoA epoxidase subunit PaaD